MPKVWTDSKFKMPERLYRYRPLANEKHWDYLEQILLDSTMYGAPPTVLREEDPEEYLFTAPASRKSFPIETLPRWPAGQDEPLTLQTHG